MTIEPIIILGNVNLHYSVAAFNESSLKSWLLNLMNKSYIQTSLTDIHALKDVSVVIREGERVGLLGHNGSGKSTFLKAIAGLYPISSGKLSVDGSIRSLLEISTGFEPDATGRENILYRGLLIGLKPKVIKEKIKEIVEFADLGSFIDYPLKTYSSGVQVRLAFAISTSFSGNILLVDEVIGVGDANFMVKAKARISNLIAESQIFVIASHDFTTMASICNRGLLFDHGKLIYDGPIDNAIIEYKIANPT